MKTIYILLTRTDTWVSRTIGLLTADPYTHASIAFNAELQPMYSFARYYPNMPLPAGLRIEPLHKGFFKKQSHVPCALYALEVTDEVYDAARREVDRMMLEAPRYQFSVIGLDPVQAEHPVPPAASFLLLRVRQRGAASQQGPHPAQGPLPDAPRRLHPDPGPDLPVRGPAEPAGLLPARPAARRPQGGPVA